jgi:hypothetical protein
MQQRLVKTRGRFLKHAGSYRLPLVDGHLNRSEKWAFWAFAGMRDPKPAGKHRRPKTGLNLAEGGRLV